VKQNIGGEAGQGFWSGWVERGKGMGQGFPFPVGRSGE